VDVVKGEAEEDDTHDEREERHHHRRPGLEQDDLHTARQTVSQART
jgi:hypothetical protein